MYVKLDYRGLFAMKLFLVLFAAVWIGGIGAANASVLYDIWKAARATAWSTTDGVVTQCELKYGRKRGSVSLNLKYSYQVDGQDYIGEVYEPGPHFLPSDKWPRVKAKLPVGAAVVVFYNPADPGNAMLNPGVRPDILPIMLALLPFTLVAIVLGIVTWRSFFPRREFNPARDVRNGPTGVHVRLNSTTPLMIFGLALLGLSFVATFLVALLIHSYWGVPPSWTLDGGIIFAILILSILLARRFGSTREIIDNGDTLTVPTTPDGRASMEIPIRDIQGFEIRTETRIVRRKNSSGTRKVYVPILSFTEPGDQKTSDLRFAEYTRSGDAAALIAWLRERIDGSSF